MKNILIATTALVATAGIAHAEIAVSGSAAAGLIYNSEAATKTKVMYKAGVTFDASGETDGGLQFGFNSNYLIKNDANPVNDDTTIFMSGAFGKLSFGAVAEADEVAGLSDIGWDGLDVDDVAEALVGDELADLTGLSMSHNVNYTYATGPVSFSLSGLVSTSHTPTAADVSSYAAGVKYSFAQGYVGLGYGTHSAFISSVTTRSTAKVVSLFGGVNVNNIKVAGMYSDANFKDGASGVKAGANAYGLNASYTMDALTLSMGASKANFDAITGWSDQSAFGIGAAYNLGGGATVSGGLARVKSVGDENQGTGSATETRADFGVKFSF